MLSASNAFHRAVGGNGKVALRVDLTLADGTVEELDGSDLAMGGVSVTEATSSNGHFDVGSAIVGTCDLTLANYDGRFDDHDFTGSSIELYVGVELESGTEWVRRGVYHVEQPERSYGTTIGLACRDNLSLLRVPYSEVPTSYPATLGTVVSDLCAHCGVSTASGTFDNASYTVASRPDDSTLTCLDVLSYAAQAAGCFADCDPWGRVRVRWYDTSAFEAEDWLDGGSYSTDTTPYSDGDSADGGAFHSGGDDVEGGGFNSPRWASASALASLSLSTDDVVVTGVRVTASDQVTAEGTRGAAGEEALWGGEGYVLDLSGNPLVLYGQAAAVAALVGPRVVGMRFRPLDLTCVGDPAWEAGDPLLVTDASDEQYRSWVTRLTWSAGSYESLSCDAEPPARRSASYASAATRAVVEARRDARAERTARERAVGLLQQQLADSGGLYETDVRASDGSTIRYFHDKPTLAESTIVWKFTADAFAISSDGGATYPYGIDVTGSAILDRVYAVGIDASYVNTGRLVVGDPADPILYVDIDTGEVDINQAAYIAGRTVRNVMSQLDASIKGVVIEYAQNDSPTVAPTGGWSETAPTAVEGLYIWQRTGTTTWWQTSYSEPTCITGADGPQGVGISSITPQWYLSTSDTRRTGGSWSGTQPSWSEGHYIWTRSVIAWDDSTVTYTDPVLARALNGANEAAAAAQASADDAAKVATNYLNYSSETGLDIGYAGTLAKTRVSGGGINIFDENGRDCLGISASGERVGQEDESHVSIDYHSLQLIDRDGVTYMYVSDMRDENGELNLTETLSWSLEYQNRLTYAPAIEDGYQTVGLTITSVTVDGVADDPYYWRISHTGDQRYLLRTVGHTVPALNEGSVVVISYTVSSNQAIDAKAYTLGTRVDAPLLSPFSVCVGKGNAPNSFAAMALGTGCAVKLPYSTAIGYGASVDHSEERYSSVTTEYPLGEGRCIAMGTGAQACDLDTVAIGCGARAIEGKGVAIGDHVVAGLEGVALGRYGALPRGRGSGGTYANEPPLRVGGGYDESNRYDVLTVTRSKLWISGTLEQNSDRRLKEHVSYLGEDACEFVRRLRPALYEKDGGRHLGFYAQDVEEADEWGTETVGCEHTDETLGFDPLTLDYSALVAPLVAYAQALERRLDEQQETIDRLAGRLDALGAQ